MPVCLCANISILWRLPVGTWDKLISWLSSCPGSSLLLSLYLFQRLRLTSTLHLTRWDEYTCFMVVQKKKAIWGSGLITFLSVRLMSPADYQAKTHFMDHVYFSCLPKNHSSMHIWLTRTVLTPPLRILSHIWPSFHLFSCFVVFPLLRYIETDKVINSKFHIFFLREVIGHFLSAGYCVSNQ